MKNFTIPKSNSSINSCPICNAELKVEYKDCLLVPKATYQGSSEVRSSNSCKLHYFEFIATLKGHLIYTEINLISNILDRNKFSKYSYEYPKALRIENYYNEHLPEIIRKTKSIVSSCSAIYNSNNNFTRYLTGSNDFSFSRERLLELDFPHLTEATKTAKLYFLFS